MLALLGPIQGDAFAQFLKGQVARLAAVENRLNDVRRKERTPENLSNVSFRQARMPGKRSLIAGLPLEHSLVPLVIVAGETNDLGEGGDMQMVE